MNEAVTDGWRSHPTVDKMCPRCQEERRISTATINGRTMHYCDTCALTWDANSGQIIARR